MTSPIDLEESMLTELTTLNLSTLFPSSIQYPNQSLQLTEDPMKPTEKYKYKFSHQQSNILFPEPVLYGLSFYSNILGAVGNQTVSIYSVSEDTSITEISQFKIANTELYCISFAKNAITSSLLCAVGGLNPIIFVLDITNEKEFTQLIGHKNEIYDIKFHPINSNLLLSASKDNSIRLWNIITQKQLCIFGGPMGHVAEVLSVSWHNSGKIFASSGIDNSVKIFQLNEKIEKKIEEDANSINNTDNDTKTNVKTLLKSNPLFSCSTIHKNYIDCVQFNGNLILTKSVHGDIKEWYPMFNKESDYYYLMNLYSYHIKISIWYIKFVYDEIDDLMLVGNDFGQCYLFQVRNSSNAVSIINTNKNDHQKKGEKKIYNAVEWDDVLNMKSEKITRAISYSPELKIAAVANCVGEITIIKIEKELL